MVRESEILWLDDKLLANWRDQMLETQWVLLKSDRLRVHEFVRVLMDCVMALVLVLVLEWEMDSLLDH